MKTTLAIMDSDGAYAVRFMEAASGRSGLPFEVAAFTERAALADYVRQNKVDVLLVSEDDAGDQVMRLPAAHILVLSGERREGGMAGGESGTGVVGRGVIVGRGGVEDRAGGEGRTGGWTIFKYQSVPAILREVMEYISREGDAEEDGDSPVIKPRMSVAGVFSPAGRCGKTSFARALGRVLARTRPTLLADLESCSPGLGTGRAAESGEGRGNISDVIYYIRQGERSVSARLMAMVGEDGKLGVLPPVGTPGDVLKVSGEEWEILFRSIRRESPYESLVIDLGDVPYTSPSVFDECDVIYMPVPADPVSAAKADAYEAYILSAGMSHAVHRMKRIALPDPGNVSGHGVSGLYEAEAARCAAEDDL